MVTRPAPRSRRGAAVVGVLVALAALLPTPASPVAAQVPAVVPTQWIAAQFTEGLGRAPSPTEWETWVDHYETDGCTTTSLRDLTRHVLLGAELAGRYAAADKGARIIALVRAVYAHEPNTNDWAAYYTPYANGTRTWAQTVDAIFVGVFVAWVEPSVCSATTPGYGFGASAPLDVRSLTGGGTSRTQATLQAQLDAAAPTCGTVALQPTEVVRIGGPPSNQVLTVPACVTLTTTGAPPAGAYARQGRLVSAGTACGGFICTGASLVGLGTGAELRSVWVDTRGSAAGAKTSGVLVTGSSVADPAVVQDVRVTDPGANGTGILLSGRSITGTACDGAVVSGNVVTGYARAHALDRAGQAQWADGIAVHCEGATISGNDVVDVGDWGIALFGVRHRTLGLATQRSVVTGNRVLSAGVPGSVALAADPVGLCRTVGDGLPAACLDSAEERSFAGARIEGNTFWTGPRTSFDVGIMVGSKTYWGDHGAYGRGLVVADNTTGTSSARVNVGIAVSGMYGTTLTGNTAAYTLVDTIGGTVADLPGCPLVAVGDTRPYLASFTPGSQASTTTGLYGCLLPPTPTGGLEKVVATTAGGGSFVGSVTGLPFTPFGHNYGPTTSILVEDIWDTPAGFAEIVRDMVELRQLGTNTLRIHPQLNRFMLDPTTPNPAAFDRLERLAQVAEDLGLYLDVTGLGVWRPADNRDDPGDPNDADEAWLASPDEAQRWEAQEIFWRETARRLHDETSVLFYNLMNEPVVTLSDWACPGGVTYGGFCFVQALTLTPGGRPHADIVRTWVTRMRSAIREWDTTTPVSVGSLGAYGWKPNLIGDITDMMVTHNYPGEDPAYPGDEIAADVAMARSFATPGKPLVADEFFFALDGDGVAPHLGCDVACLERALHESRPEVDGWLGHAGGEVPSAMDPWADLFGLMWIQFFQRVLPLVAPCRACQPG